MGLFEELFREHKVIKKWNIYSNYKAIIIANMGGFLKGYIGVPPESVLHGKRAKSCINEIPKEYLNKEGKKLSNIIGDIKSIKVHGGVTSSWECKDGEFEKGYWFFEFHTSHDSDLHSKEIIFKYFNEEKELLRASEVFYEYQRYSKIRGATHKDLNYVIAECEALASQLTNIELKYKDV